jgi:dihydrofolate synthase / folylpolyglutamate synthase
LTRQALSAWLERLERRAPESRIELGLERVAEVWRQLQTRPITAPVITVAGTNGKGSTVAFLEAICRAAGYSTLAYTSPHLIEFGERMRLNGKPANPAAIVEALERVELARGDTFLSYFEHITLAALTLAEVECPQVLILEVGLGGRLDAVNVIDADVAIMTSIGLDHTEWLGRTRLAIGREKAGVARPHRPLVLGEKRLPAGLVEGLTAARIQCLRAGRDFRWRRHGGGWTLQTPLRKRRLPAPALAGAWQLSNAACAVMALECLAERLPMTESAIHRGLEEVSLFGRMQRVGGAPEIILDVAHNPAAARQLAAELGPAEGPSVAVFSALSDKDVTGIARALNGCFNHWLLAPLGGYRGQSSQALQTRLASASVKGGLETVESVPAALTRARELAGSRGRVVVFGSFRTVAEAWPALDLLK